MLLMACGVSWLQVLWYRICRLQGYMVHSIHIDHGLESHEYCRLLSIPAMAEPTKDPVLEAWANSPVVMAQILKDRLVILQYPKLGRATLADNTDILAPLISHVGA